MLSKNKIKFIRSLDRKKERKESGCFLAEGNKWVADSLGIFSCECLVATPEWLEQNPVPAGTEVIRVSPEEMSKVSLLKSPQDVLAVFRIPDQNIDFPDFEKTLSLALDCIQDPGNLGTIIRLADWYGIEHIFCSPDCADVYNPKVVQATMGALARVRIQYLPLNELFESLSSDIPVYGTFLDGENIYDKQLTVNGIIVMGNEGNGISDALKPCISERLYLPSYPPERETTESLNVAIATAIVCAEFRRIACKM